MNEKAIKDLILTVYLDGEANPDEQKHLEDILAKHPEYQEFAEQVKRVAVDPFEKVQKLEPSPQVWQNIKAEIAPQEEAQTFDEADSMFGFGWLIRLIFAPRPAFALATIAVVMFAVIMFNRPVDIASNGNGEYIEYALEEISFLGYEEELAFDTAIEEYFL